MKQLLLIHGAIGGYDQLIPLKEILSDEFDVHLLEFAGHGKKAEVNAPYSLEGFSKQLSESLDGLDQVHIFGYSMGGFVALWHAANGAEQVASITTLGTKMEWSEEIAQKESKQLNPAVIAAKVPKFAQALEKRHGEHWEEVLNRTASFMEELGRNQPIQETLMNQLDVPVQLCLADQDAMVSKKETEQVHQWITGSNMEMIPNSKHPIEQVDLMALASTIKSFINRLD